MTKKARRSPRDSKITRSAKKEKKQRSQEFISYYQMGGRVDKPMAEKLHITYDGKVCGLLKEGAILSNHTHGRALDPTITTCMLKSLGSVEKIKLVEKDDLDEFSIEINHPKCKDYTPFFFDRHNEYGRDHKYYESLCHSFPRRDILNTSSARYFKKNGEALLVQHLPVTLPICAFLEAFREKNKALLEDLRSELYSFIKNIDTTDEKLKNNLPLSNEMADSVIDGAFRNVSIQIHYSSCSHTMDLLTHMDHVFSSLHMGVTLHGKRSVGFMTPGDNPYNNIPKILEMEEGDIYITTPAAILHGIQMEDLKCEQRSVALQCRTHLDAKEAQTWSQYKRELSGVVQICLKRNTITIPNLEEFNLSLKDLETKCPYEETNEKYLFVNKSFA